MTPDLFLDGIFSGAALPSAYGDALVLALLSSLVWAPTVFIGALLLDRAQRLGVSEKIWITALGVAVLPALLTPALAAAGISLRPPAPQPELIYVHAENIALTEGYVVADAPPPLFTIEKAIGLAGMFYFYGALMAGFVWATKGAAFAWTVAAAKRVDDHVLLQAVDTWRARMGVLARPRIKRSPHVSSVCVQGVLRPVILIPDEIDIRITPDDLALMCAHEMAHIKRGDAKLFALTSILRIVFWFNPAVRQLAARAELTAEQSADSLVVTRGANRRAYAACFVEGLKFAADKSQGRLMVAPTFTPFDRKGRRRRLDSILSDGPSLEMPAGKRALFIAIGATAGILAVGQAAFAVDPGAGSSRAFGDASLELMPVDGSILLHFGEHINGAESQPRHEGIDIKARYGTAIVAPGNGTVIAATNNYAGEAAWGNVVIIDHGGGLMTRYAHLDRYDVKSGDRVWSGDVIGKVGTSGVSTGPHLHFETLLDGVQIDPLKALNMDGGAADRARAPRQTRKTATRETTELVLAGDEPEKTEASGNGFGWTAAPKRLVAFEEFAELKALEAFSQFELLGSLSALTAPSPEAAPIPSTLPKPDWAANPAPVVSPDFVLEVDIRKKIMGARTFEFRFQTEDSKNRVLVSTRKLLTAKQRADVEKSLSKMRAQMAAERARRERQREAAHEKHTHERHIEHKTMELAQKPMSYHKRGQTDFDRIRREALTEQSRALAEARRGLVRADRDNARDMSASKRDLAVMERELKKLVLPENHMEIAKRRIAEANRAIEKSSERSKTALKKAKAEIDAQQTEIKRLRKDLDAARKAAMKKDKSSR